MTASTVFGLLGFYLGLAGIFGALLLVRNYLSSARFGSRWFGVPLVAYHAILVGVAFGGLILHDRWFGELTRSIDNQWLLLLAVFSPMIWVAIVAAFFNRFVGR